MKPIGRTGFRGAWMAAALAAGLALWASSAAITGAPAANAADAKPRPTAPTGPTDPTGPAAAAAAVDPANPTNPTAPTGPTDPTAAVPAIAPRATATATAPLPPQPPVGLAGDSHLDKEPPRKTRGLNLVKMGWTYDCLECHRSLEPRWHYDRPMAEHSHIRLNHGNNRFCLNCHHPSNRNAFVDYDGSEIAQSDVVLLCAKCHGPTYRDWEAGAHGRRNGYWDTTRGPRTRLKCIQCHDPHDPAFKPLAPEPPPRNRQHAPGEQPAHEAGR